MSTTPTPTAVSRRKLRAPSMEVLMQDVLHIITGRMLSSSEDYDSIFEVMQYMLDSRIDEHSYPRALTFCRKELIKQHPKLAVYVTAEWDPAQTVRWLKKVYRELGLKSEYMKVVPCGEDDQDKFAEDEEEALLNRRPPRKRAKPKRVDSLLRFEDDGE